MSLLRRRSPATAMTALLLVGGAPAIAGCRRDGDEDLGLGRRAPATEAIDLAHLAAPGALERALGAAAAASARLGAHRRVQELKMTVAQGARSDALVETWRTEVDAQGAVHALHETLREPRWDGGIEWWATGGRLYVRLAHGRTASRDPQGDEIDRARDEQEGALAGYLAVLGRFAARADRGEQAVASLGGRSAREVTLSLAPSPAPPAEEDADPASAWRKSVAVKALDGVVDLDAATGAPLRTKLDATYSLSQGGKETTVNLHYTSAVEALGAVPTIAPPDDAQPEAPRPRPLVDRALLLEGLVAPKPGAPSLAPALP